MILAHWTRKLGEHDKHRHCPHAKLPGVFPEALATEVIYGVCTRSSHVALSPSSSFPRMQAVATALKKGSSRRDAGLVLRMAGAGSLSSAQLACPPFVWTYSDICLQHLCVCCCSIPEMTLVGLCVLLRMFSAEGRIVSASVPGGVGGNCYIMSGGV